MKNRKLNKSGRVLVVVIGILLIVITILFVIPKKAFQVVLDKDTFSLGQNLEGNFKATNKKEDITANVTFEGYDANKIGKQKVTFLWKDKKVVITIKVQDQEAPVITLKGSPNMVISINEPFEDPGYEAKDNYDGDLTKEVKISGSVDIKKEGEYILTYSVKDNSGNKTIEKRNVKVSAHTPLTMGLKDFSLDGLFMNVQLKETEDVGEEYIDQFIYAGDSMALYYVINKPAPGSRLWHQVSINPETALTSQIYINHQDTNQTFVQNLKERKPEYMLFTLGTNGIAYMEVDYFISCYEKLLKQMMEASPNTTIIVQSIPPVDAKFDKNKTGINNDKINKVNYRLLELCSKLNVPFLNSAGAMKDENGACKPGYCLESDGIHPTKEGQEQLIKYQRTHAFKK